MLGAAVVCFIAANVLAAPLLAWAALLFLLLVAVGAVVVFVPDAKGHVARTVSTDLIMVDESSQISVRMGLRGRLIRNALWHDALPESVEGDARGALADGVVQPDESITVSYSVRGRTRGVWEIGPLHLHTTDPFGLLNRTQAVGEPNPITIVPALVALPRLIRALGAGGGILHTAASRVGPGVDNLAPRRYLPGDPMRRIHWRATAHRGDLMVRQEEEEASPDAVIVLDVNPSRWPGHERGPLAQFELAVSICASAAIQLEEDGYSVDVVDVAGNVLGLLRGNEGEQQELLVALASVRVSGVDATFRTEASPVGPFVFITGRIADESGQVPKHPPTGMPIVIAADPQPGALEALRAEGWSAARADEVMSDA